MLYKIVAWQVSVNILSYFLQRGSFDLKRKFYTLFIFSDQCQISKVKIPKYCINISILFTLAVVIALSFIVSDYIKLKKRKIKVEKLRKEKILQEEQLKFFSKKISYLEKSLKKLEELDHKIRIIANIEHPDTNSFSLGVGGITRSRSSRHRKKYDFTRKRELIARLHIESERQKESLNELYYFLRKKRSLLAHTPSIWPSVGWVTSGFGRRINPFTGRTEFHKGIDIANRVGTPVIATADGIVIKNCYDGAYGLTLLINHGNGIITRYSHLRKAFCKVGQKVKRGDKIGEIGTSGRTTGPHLHYEVIVNNVSRNPRKYILN